MYVVLQEILTGLQSEASKAVVQAGAAVAAATGMASHKRTVDLHADSSRLRRCSWFISTRCCCESNAKCSIISLCCRSKLLALEDISRARLKGSQAAAASQIAQASQQVTASQTAAITASQAAIAIVGSIIASTLITILIYFLVIRHKDRAKKKSGSERSPGIRSRSGSGEGNFTTSDQVGTTIAASQSAYGGARNTGSQVSFSLFPKPNAGDDPRRNSMVKTTSVLWDPKNPPKPPSLGSWLKVQNVSPFGSIKLPTDDEKSEGPLGGQLKSPLRTSSSEKSPIAQVPKFLSSLPLRSPKIPVLTYQTPSMSTIEQSSSRSVSVKRKPVSPETEPEKADTLPQHPAPHLSYRESKASIWTDSLSDEYPSPMLPSPPPELLGNEPPSSTNGYEMRIPSIQKPVRTTAEWLMDQNTAVARAVNLKVISINPRDRNQTRNQNRNTDDRIQNPRNNEHEAWRPNAQLTLQRESQGPWRPNTSYTQPQISPRRLNLESRPSFGLGLPNGAPGQRGKQGLPSGPRGRDIKSLSGEVGYVRGLSRFLDPSRRGSLLGREGSQRSAMSGISRMSGDRTLSVGKAL
jgi:hypothetical protein